MLGCGVRGSTGRVIVTVQAYACQARVDASLTSLADGVAVSVLDHMNVLYGARRAL